MKKPLNITVLKFVMIRKIIIRSFLACCALFVVFVVAAAGCFWLVKQQPSFYAELREQQFSEDERLEVSERLESMATSIEQWAAMAAYQQKRPLEDLQNPFIRNDNELASTTKAFTFSQYDLNALLTFKDNRRADFRNLRAQILDDRIRLAGELFLSAESPVVLSADFNLSTVDGDKLKFELMGGCLGRLPVPLQWLLQHIPDDAFASDEKFETHFSADMPYVLLDVADANQSNPVIRKIKTVQGKVTLEMGAPVVAF